MTTERLYVCIYMYTRKLCQSVSEQFVSNYKCTFVERQECCLKAYLVPPLLATVVRLVAAGSCMGSEAIMSRP